MSGKRNLAAPPFGYEVKPLNSPVYCGPLQSAVVLSGLMLSLIPLLLLETLLFRALIPVLPGFRCARELVLAKASLDHAAGFE